jgi:hypothetical protein
MRNQVALAAVVACLGAAPRPALAERLFGIEEIGGLAAWYRADSLRGKLRNGDPVTTWDDQSGNGHHLTDDRNGQPALYIDSQLVGPPVVQVRSANSHSVTAPFELTEHALFLVYKADARARALFRGSPHHGVLLGADGDRHVYQNGGILPNQLVGYCKPTELPAGYSITVLGRDRSGALKSFINGKDVSSGLVLSDPIQVAKFFDLRQTRYATSDGGGLWIAELVIYGRYLGDAERDSVMLHLSRKYGIEAAIGTSFEEPAALPRPPAGGGAPGLAQLRTTSQANLNAPSGITIPWDIQDELGPPLAHDPKPPAGSRLCSTRDGTRVRLHVSLPLRAATPGPSVQLLFLKNGKDYLEVRSWSGPFARSASETDPPVAVYRSALAGDVVMRLDSGDCVEVVTWKAGDDGEVTLEPRRAVLIAEAE